MKRQGLDQKTLDDIIRRIVEVAQPERIILFGSAARGDMTRNSIVMRWSSSRHYKRAEWCMSPPERFPPDDPREWLNRARSSFSSPLEEG